MTQEPRKPSRKYFTSEAVRVKRTPITRRYGVKCRTTEPMNDRVWAGEVGRLVQTTMAGVDWWQKVLVAEFPYGRRLTVAGSQLYSTKTPPEEQPAPVWSFEIGFDVDDFVTIPKLPQE